MFSCFTGVAAQLVHTIVSCSLNRYLGEGGNYMLENVINEGNGDEETSPFISVLMLGPPVYCRKHVKHCIEILICLLKFAYCMERLNIKLNFKPVL